MAPHPFPTELFDLQRNVSILIRSKTPDPPDGFHRPTSRRNPGGKNRLSVKT